MASWQGGLDLPPDPATGKRRQQRVSAKTRRECEALVAAALAAAEAGGSADAGRLTGREYLDRWLAATEPTLKASTFRRYADTARLHVAPLIGSSTSPS